MAPACVVLMALVGRAAGQEDVVYYDSLDEHGNLVGGRTTLPSADLTNLPAIVPPLRVVELDVEGREVAFSERRTAGDRIDLVIVGDGYQAAQLGSYATHATSTIAAFFTTEPYRNYQSFFRISRVDVVSVDSGVDNDPTQGILRNTALNMAYWCGGTERLLCVSVANAVAYANTAPNGWNQILAIANSTKYGGAGYPGNDLATSAGNNSSAAQIAIHEFGHSIGNLADEYDYGGPAVYPGPEPSSVNSSMLTAAQMTAQSAKWFRWVGVNNTAFDGLVNSYQGSSYSTTGVYRPTNNSLMRNLGRPFNLPSAEALIIEFYKVVEPINTISHPTTTVLTGAETVTVTPMALLQNTWGFTWLLDGAPIAGQTGASINLSNLDLSNGSHTLGVQVIDNTTWVRDPNARALWMTQTKQWSMNVNRCPADMDNGTGTGTRDGGVDVNDLIYFLNRFEAGAIAADLDGDGVNPPNPDGGVDINDLLFFLMRFEAGC